MFPYYADGIEALDHWISVPHALRVVKYVEQVGGPAGEGGGDGGGEDKGGGGVAEGGRGGGVEDGDEALVFGE